MTIAEKIFKLRNDNGLSQKDFADRVGTSQSAINYWENGKRQPRTTQLKKISLAFGIPLHYFLDDDLFDVATSPDAEYEGKFLDQKLNSIIENEKLSELEKKSQLQDYLIQMEIVQNMHEHNADAAGKYLLGRLFDQLNYTGQEKALEQLELLIKIPEYRKDYEE